MTSLVDIDRAEKALDWDLTDAECIDLEDQAEYLSDLARQEGGQTWPTVCPSIVESTIRAALVRYMRNADGYTQSRAGDETLGWDGIGDKAGAPYFTASELKTIRTAGGRRAFGSVLMNAWGSSNRLRDGNVPDPDGGKPFPLFPNGDGPW